MLLSSQGGFIGHIQKKIKFQFQVSEKPLEINKTENKQTKQQQQQQNLQNKTPKANTTF